jgi:type I restriction enzyme S subunit
LSANVILIKPIECPAFVYWSLISDYVNVQVSLAIHSTSQPAFGMEKIRALNIITPQPKEREVITEKLKAFENIFSEEEKKLYKLKSIKTGLMQDLLSGKKRVTHLIN